MRLSNLLRHKNAPLYALIALLIFIFAVRLISLSLYPLMSTTEARYAEMSRKILELNEWIVLFYYDYETPFWGKPPLSFWASAVSMWLFGVNEFGARFAPFVFGLLCYALFFAWQFRREVNESKALRPIACAVILSSTGIGFVASGAVMTDEALLFCVMLCMISFWKCAVGNSSLELHSVRLLGFGASQTPSLVSAPKIPKNYESQTENPSVVDSTQGVESSKKIKIKKHIKSFCYFWLIPKVESPLPLNPNLPIAQSKKIVCDSQVAKMDSSLTSLLKNDESGVDCHESNKHNAPRGSIFRRFCGFSSAKQGNKTDSSIDEAEREESRKSVKKTNAQIIFGYLFFIGLGLGLLAKGPLIFVLVGLPIVAFIIALHFAPKFGFAPQILHLKNLPFVGGTILMLLIALPWYIAFEVKSSGFLEYFIIGEHFKRFFVSGWEGSLYGAAHSQPIGTIWWFFLISFLPWSLVFLGFIAQKTYIFCKIQSDFGAKIATLKTPQSIENLYLILWIVMPLCFLTFSRNILEAYTLPTAPAFCILCVNFIFGAGKNFRRRIWLLPLALMLILCAFLASGKLDSLVDSRHQKDIFTRWDGEGRLIFIDAKPSFSGYFYAHQSGKKPFKDEFLSLKSPEIAEILDSSEKICIAMKESDFNANKERFGNFRPIVAKKEWILLQNY